MEDLLDDRNALGMVRLEHSRLDELLQSALESTQPDFTNQVTRALLRELDIHSVLEHEFLLPFLKARLPQNKFSQAIRENVRVEELKTKLQSLDATDPEYYPTLHELVKQFELHRFSSEQFGLSLVEHHDPYVHNKLVNLADQMQQRRIDLLSGEPRGS